MPDTLGKFAPRSRHSLKVKRKKVAFSTLKVLSVAFKSDHDKLKDNTADWKNTGSRYAKPEWKEGGSPNHPISHSMDKEVQLEVKIELGPAGATKAKGKLIATGPDWLTCEAEVAELAPGESTHTLTSKGKVPKQVKKASESIAWKVEPEGGSAVDGGSTGAHTVYCTVDTPKDDMPKDEDGVTVKRMEKAVEWVGSAGSLAPHTIVSALMRKFRGYVLYPSDKVPAKYDHPGFMRNNEGGAWPLAEYYNEAGECQAIVRCVRGNLRQVGVPGEAKIMVVWSEPKPSDDDATTMEGDWEADPGAGLDTSKTGSDGQSWGAALVDGIVEEGKWYPPSHSRMKDGRSSPGLNRYEACLKFTADGESKYYGGGAGTYDSKDEVIMAFRGLIWVAWEKPKTTDYYFEDRLKNEYGYRVKKIVKKYYWS